MTSSFIQYEISGDMPGRITVIGRGILPGNMELMSGDLSGVLEGIADPAHQYVDIATLSVIDRPPAASSLLTLPRPCIVSVRSHALGTTDTYTVTDGSFEYSDQPGAYTITVRAWPCLDAVFEVTL